MKKYMKQLIALILALLSLFSATSVFAEEALHLESAYFDMVFTAVKRHYKFDLDEEGIIRDLATKALKEKPELLEDFLDILGNHMDQHSDYFTKEEFDQFLAVTNAQYVGIGVTVQRQIGAVTIMSVVPGGTADMAGLKAGDKILAVGNQDVTDYSVNDLTPLIKGEAGTTVQLTIRRGERSMAFSVLRAQVASPTAQYQKLDEGIGYLQIASFNGTTPLNIQEADAYFKEEGIKKLIIDLRNNPGGELLSVVTSLGFFVPKGKTLINIEYADPARNTSLRSVGNLTKPYYDKLVVLVNGSSASAAELFAGNIKHHKLGTLVGVDTYGKGTVQEFLSLPSLPDVELGEMKITAAEYLLPGGEKVNGVGVKPHVRVVNREIRFPDDEYEPLKFLRDYKEGDVHDGVFAIKQRFSALGYFVGEVDENYDHELTLSVRQFQKAMEIPVTGEMDYQTQKVFIEFLENLRVTVDEQFEKAMELVSK